MVVPVGSAKYVAPQVPVYAAAFFNGRFKAGASQSDAVAETKDFVRAALRLVEQQPYWARRGGSDHVFVFAQDFGRCNLAPPEVGPAIAIQINGDPLPGDGAWGGAQGDFDEDPDPSYDAPSAAAAELRARGEAGAARCFEAGRDIVVPPLVEPPDALLPALLASNASLLVAPYWSAASAAAAASCDCTWAQPAAACDGGDDGTPCWRGCCAVLARFHGAVERLAPSYSFGVRQQLWRHFKVRIGTCACMQWCMHAFACIYVRMHAYACISCICTCTCTCICPCACTLPHPLALALTRTIERSACNRAARRVRTPPSTGASCLPPPSASRHPGTRAGRYATLTPFLALS